jgi:ADP-ribose pyrophosphatase YjhB (NUDIX family)
MHHAKNKNNPVCQNCGFVFYQNPAAGVAAVIIRNKKILLGKRNGSYQGKWCIPCGHIDWGEDVHDAVKRELLEETGLIIEPLNVYAVLSNFHNEEQYTVGIWFMAEEKGGVLQAGDDLKEVSFFCYDDLPELAFPTDRIILQRLKEDKLIS